jgi:uncharacterized protein (TIGR02284 family)
LLPARGAQTLKKVARAVGFRDFLTLPAAKKNRNGSLRTLSAIPCFITVVKDNLMSNPSKTLTKTEDTLRSVIESLIDGQEGFQKIGDNLKNDTLKRYFLAESLKRAQFRGALEEVLHQEGVHDVKESGTVSGAMHRAWGDLKSKLGGGDHTLLETAEQGEDVAKKAYADALEEEKLPLPIRQILVSQAAHIQSSHDYVKAARDRTM